MELMFISEVADLTYFEVEVTWKHIFDVILCKEKEKENTQHILHY